MRRKLDLAMTLIGRPRIIFLDEPTTGLDPRSRRTMWEIIRELVADGVTIFLTTQYLEEADQLADRIAVLDQGHLVAQGAPEDLKRQVPGGHVRFRFTDVRALDAAARVLTGSTRDDENLIRVSRWR
jgi:ABC-2 type transport system ATP-binding protein